MSIPNSIPNPPANDPSRILRVLSFNVWGLAFIAKERKARIRAIADYLSSSNYDIVCLQELWVYKDFELVRQEISHNLPFSRFFHTGALGSGLAIFTRFPLISAQALPYSFSGSPAHAIEGDFFVKKAAANVVLLHPILGEIEVWNTHMHAAGEQGPDVRQAHRIAQSWQLANAIRSGAAKGRYILAMGDFNSQPWSVPIRMLRNHASLFDSYLDAHPTANTDQSPQPSALEALEVYGMTCDSKLNSWSADKNIPDNVTEKGGKRLDYIFYRQPEIARRRPLVWGYRDDESYGNSNSNRNGSGSSSGNDGFSGDGQLEEGKPIPASVAKAPRLKCVRSEVVLTERVPGRPFSYSDHFGLCSTFTIEHPSKLSNSTVSAGNGSKGGDKNSRGVNNNDSKGTTTFTPITDMITEAEAEAVNPTTTTFGSYNPPLSPRASTSSTARSTVVRSALDTLRLYTLLSEKTSKNHLRICGSSLIILILLTIGSAWQPKSYIQPIFTLLGGLLGASTATFLYTGFVWGRWEAGLLAEVTEEMELELRVVEMEEKMNAF